MWSLLRVSIVLLLFCQTCAATAYDTARRTSESAPCNNSNLNIREKFLCNFRRRCSKYPFIHNYVRKQRSRSTGGDGWKKFLIFSFHAKKLKNGGLGDRMGGLISAFMHSERFNRTMLVKASNGLHRLFRPFPYLHLDDGSLSTECSSSRCHYYSWANCSSWSGLRAYKDNLRHAGIPIRHEVMDCISNAVEGFSEEKTAYCAMDAGELHIDEPFVEFRSNRAYLCRWMRNLDGNDLEVVESLLGNVSSTKEAVDLFEIAGCILRVLLWPTDALWDMVDEVYESWWLKLRHLHDVPVTKWTETGKPPLQIGLHFRCGDPWSFSGLKLNSKDYDRSACVFENNSTAGAKSYYMNAGNPVEIASCAKNVLQTELKGAMQTVADEQQLCPASGDDDDFQIQDWEGNFYYYNDEVDSSIDADEETDSKSHYSQVKEAYYQQCDSMTKNKTTHPKKLHNNVVFISSDNIMASLQMNQTIGHTMTLVSPQGCHIELDPSIACFQHTVLYWFILSLSDIFISQTFTELHAPTSSFSRYAGIYSLSGVNVTPFRSAKHCNEFYSTASVAQVQQGNWFC